MERLICALLLWILIEGGRGKELHKQKDGERVKCSLPPLPKGVQYQANNQGNRLFYRCNMGHKTLGDIFSVCEDGRWSSKPPICIAAGCKMVYHVTHGRMLIGYGGAMATFTCNHGFKMIGSEVIVCDGKEWNSTTPVCTDSTDVERGGRITHRHTSKSHSDWLEESDYSCIKQTKSIRPPELDHTQSTTQWAVIGGKPRLYTVYRCQWGYVSRGKANKLYCKNGDWIGGLPKCVLAVTTKLATVPRDQSDPAKRTHADWLTMSDYTCMGTSKLPRLPPKPAANGKYALRYDAVNGMPRLFAELTCDAGYTHHDNQTQIYCNDRSWIGPELRCVSNTMRDKVNHDPCADNNGGCDHVCRKSRGGYSCDCYVGYQLADDGHSCKQAGRSSKDDLIPPMALFHQ